jgi:hypothetical protein
MVTDVTVCTSCRCRAAAQGCTLGSEPWRGSLSDRILMAENQHRDADVALRLKGVTGFQVSARSPKTAAPLSAFHRVIGTRKRDRHLQRRRASIERATVSPARE